MSDFLSNLVSRHLGAAPVIRPRLPSLFEPSVPFLGSFAETAPRADESRREASVEPALEKRKWEPREAADNPVPIRRDETKGFVSPQLPVPVRAAEPAHEPVIRSKESVSVPAPYMAPRETVVTVQPAALAGNSAAYAEKPIQPSMPVSEPSSKSLLRGRGPTDIEVPRTTERKVPPAVEGAPPALRKNIAAGVDRPAERRAETKIEASEGAAIESAGTRVPVPQPFRETAESRLTLPSAEPVQARRSPPPAAAPIEPAAPTRFEFARHVPPARQTPPPEPTIQVTIGRIEVRAVSSQGTPKKERSESPVMSLNEYLRSKRGGA
jgi:hypothetical protein